VLSRAIENQPAYPFAYVDRSRARIAEQKLEGAEQDLSRAIELQPEYPWNYFDRGRVRVELGELEEARSDFSTAIEMMPEMFMSYIERGRVHDSLGNPRKAYQDYKKALELRPEYHPGYAPYGMYAFMQQDWDTATEMFRKAYENKQRRHSYALLSALSLKKAGREEEARSYIERILPEIPRDTLYYDMARYYVQPHGDSALLRKVERSEDRIVKAQLLFHLGALYEIEGEQRLAQTMFVEVQDQGGPAIIERRLAEWKLQPDE